ILSRRAARDVSKDLARASARLMGPIPLAPDSRAGFLHSLIARGRPRCRRHHARSNRHRFGTCAWRHRSKKLERELERIAARGSIANASSPPTLKFQRKRRAPAPPVLTFYFPPPISLFFA